MFNIISIIILLALLISFLPLITMLLVSGMTLLFKGTDMALRRMMKVLLGMGRER